MLVSCAVCKHVFTIGWISPQQSYVNMLVLRWSNFRNAWAKREPLVLEKADVKCLTPQDCTGAADGNFLLSFRRKIQAAKNLRGRNAYLTNFSHDSFHIHTAPYNHKWKLASTSQQPKKCWPVEYKGAKCLAQGHHKVLFEAAPVHFV